MHFLISVKKRLLTTCFCNLESETLIHLFCNCKYSEDFWKQVSMMVFDTFYKIIRADEAISSRIVILAQI